MKTIRLAITAIALTAVMVGCSNINAAEKEKSSRGSNSLADSDGEAAIHLTKKDFIEKVFNYEVNTKEWKYEGDMPAIVDFYADWCQPCKIASPILEELAKEYEGKIYVYKVNTEKERELASAFGIRSIPTFLLISMEGAPQVFSGIGQTPEATREMFRKAIDEVLLKASVEVK